MSKIVWIFYIINLYSQKFLNGSLNTLKNIQYFKKNWRKTKYREVTKQGKEMSNQGGKGKPNWSRSMNIHFSYGCGIFLYTQIQFLKTGYQHV